jgi:hypothetical protein
VIVAENPRPSESHRPATPRITWPKLVQAEPRLGLLLKEARAVRARSPNHCSNSIWYGYRGHRGIKPRLCNLVGHDRRAGPAFLQTAGAYSLAYDKIYQALPDCAHPGPFC